MTDLGIRIEGDGAKRVVHLDGSCDLATIPDLRQALQPLGPPEVMELVLDVSRLEFCDSTGLGTMLGALRRMREGGGEFAIAGASGTILRLLEITGLDSVVPLVP
ncbi:MAG TPA: STAS domain-containing protein [Actinomycetota bacterium]|jgi:anti-sigma B factor antagonist|nr:STAS domain-containing protein [Actinomycetota bacterium]